MSKSPFIRAFFYWKGRLMRLVRSPTNRSIRKIKTRRSIMTYLKKQKISSWIAILSIIFSLTISIFQPTTAQAET
jgi:hypothetical protein